VKRLGAALRMGVLNGVAAASWMPKRWRRSLMRLCGLRVGDALIFSGSLFRSTAVSIGDGTFVNFRCIFDGPVTLGRNAAIGPNVTFAVGDHELGPASGRAGAHTLRPIVIGDGAWVGAHVVVLGGVTIAAGCVIGAGAVVTRSTDPDGVYMGVPARRVRDLQPGPRVGPG
jgi:maltose O-acetyltransferase